MFKKLIFICLIIAISYYAGFKGITPENLFDWFEGSNISKTFKDTVNKTVELANENDLEKKTENVIKEIKNKITEK